MCLLYQRPIYSGNYSGGGGGGGGGECLPILAIHIFIKKLIGIDHVHFKRDWEGTHIIVIFLSVLAILIYLFKIIIDINDVHFQRDMGGGGLHQ